MDCRSGLLRQNALVNCFDIAEFERVVVRGKEKRNRFRNMGQYDAL